MRWPPQCRYQPCVWLHLAGRVVVFGCGWTFEMGGSVSATSSFGWKQSLHTGNAPGVSVWNACGGLAWPGFLSPRRCGPWAMLSKHVQRVWSLNKRGCSGSVCLHPLGDWPLRSSGYVPDPGPCRWRAGTSHLVPHLMFPALCLWSEHQQAVRTPLPLLLVKFCLLYKHQR